MENGAVTQIYIARLSGGESKVSYYSISRETEFYRAAQPLFAAALLEGKKHRSGKGLGRSRSTNKDNVTAIEEVIIPPPRKKIEVSNSLAVVTLTPPAGCTKYADCLYHNDIGGGGDRENDEETDNNPCALAKAILAIHPGLSDKIKELNNWNGSFEKGYKFSKTNSTPIETPRGPDNHSVMVGNLNDIYGFFHTHPNIPMFSATDINNLVGMLRYNSGSSLQDYFVGVKGPEGSIYMISFKGNFSDVQNLPYCDVSDTNNFDDEMLKDYSNLISLSTNYLTPDRKLNFEGQMILFQNAIMYLGLTNKVNLSKLEINNGQIFTKNITNLNTNPTPENCN